MKPSGWHFAGVEMNEVAVLRMVIMEENKG
jgi:hypothetical protein